MAENIVYDDFVGFTFNGKHSSDFNIYRVSDGSRYNVNLTPGFQDTTAKIVGGHGTLYWDSFYTSQSWSLSIAFDSVTDEIIRELSRHFSAGAIGELIFDELPYKAYTAKVQSPIQLKYICFDTEDGKRIYKGEGTIQLISYQPYAKGLYTYNNEEYLRTIYNNYNEWIGVSGLKNGADPTTFAAGTTVLPVYNCGDVEMDVTVSIPNFAAYLTQYDRFRFIYGTSPSEGAGFLEANFSSLSANSYQNGTLIYDSKTNLLRAEGNRTGIISSEIIPYNELMNQYIEYGDFWKVSTDSTRYIGVQVVGSSASTYLRATDIINTTDTTDTTDTAKQFDVKYNYLYY